MTTLCCSMNNCRIVWMDICSLHNKSNTRGEKSWIIRNWRVDIYKELNRFVRDLIEDNFLGATKKVESARTRERNNTKKIHDPLQRIETRLLNGLGKQWYEDRVKDEIALENEILDYLTQDTNAMEIQSIHLYFLVGIANTLSEEMKSCVYAYHE